jgi:serine/threonine protein kinase
VAPEVLEGDYTGEACDLWSLGVIAFMLLGGTAPFDGADDDEIIDSVKSQRPPDMQTRAWQNISEHGKNFVTALLNRDPEVGGIGIFVFVFVLFLSSCSRS